MNEKMEEIIDQTLMSMQTHAGCLTKQCKFFDLEKFGLPHFCSHENGFSASYARVPCSGCANCTPKNIEKIKRNYELEKMQEAIGCTDCIYRVQENIGRECACDNVGWRPSLGSIRCKNWRGVK
jgi:hypothetical protein